MSIVRLALRRPCTFVVAAALLVVLGPGQIQRMPADIFADVDTPVARAPILRRIQDVELGRDFGVTTEVTRGLGVEHRLVVTPPDGVQPGMAAKAVAAPEPKGA